jgi:hypothetical protein
MVLPASPANHASGEGAFVEVIRRQLNRASDGIIVLVDRAGPERLRETVLGLLPDYPDLWVSPDVEDIVRVPDGTAMILEPRAEDADYLNMNRPIFARRRLKVVLWCSEETTKILATRAVDFFDWISHRHECPPGVAMHGVLGLRAAAKANAPLIKWTGGDLQGCFRVAFPGQSFVRISATRPYYELVDAVNMADERWIVWRDVQGELLRESIVFQVAAETNGGLRMIVEDSHQGTFFPELNGISMPLRNACAAFAKVPLPNCGFWAALVGLEEWAIYLLISALHSERFTRTIKEALVQTDDPGATLVKMNHNDVVLSTDPAPFFRADPKPVNQAWIQVLRSNMNELASSALAAANSAVDSAAPEQALSLADRALEMTAQVYGKTSKKYIRAMTISARSMMRVGRLEEAQERFRDASSIASTWHAGDPRLMHDIMAGLADVLLRLGRYELAEEAVHREHDAAMKCGVEVFVRNAENRLREIRTLRGRSS